MSKTHKYGVRAVHYCTREVLQYIRENNIDYQWAGVGRDMFMAFKEDDALVLRLSFPEIELVRLPVDE